MPRMENPAPVNHIQLLGLEGGWSEEPQPRVAAGLLGPAGQIPVVSGAGTG